MKEEVKVEEVEEEPVEEDQGINIPCNFFLYFELPFVPRLCAGLYVVM